MKRTVIIVMVIAILSAVIVPVVAEAACVQTGIIVRVSGYAASGNPQYIYLRPLALSPMYYMFVTTDKEIATIATSAMVSQTRVTLTGNAASCPASPGGNAGAMVNYIINP